MPDLVLLAAEGASPAPAGADTGLLLIAGLGAIAFAVGHATRKWLSEVIVFLGIGIVIGPEVLDVVDADALVALDPVIALALGAIVFGIGERLELSALREIRHTLTPMAVLENVASFGLALALPMLLGVDIGVAFLLGAIALSTSPTTLVAVISNKRAKGGFTDHALAATALNNVTSALMYGIGLPFVLASRSPDGASQGLVAFAQLLLLSAAIGGLAAFVLRRFMHTVHRPGERLLFVLLAVTAVVAASRATGAPVVISTLVAGALTANDRRDTRPLFEALRTLEAPIFLVFFLVAGANVHFSELVSVAALAGLYVVGRGAGKLAGAWLGLELVRSGRRSGWAPWMGASLMPFAGMAIGLAAFTVEKANAAGIADLGSDVSNVVLGAVVIFELIGPITVGKALDATGETGRQPAADAAFDADAPHLVRHILVPISSVEMAHRKAPQIVDLASSAGATLSALHISRPGQASPEADAALQAVARLAGKRGVQCEQIVKEGESVVDTIVDVARVAAVDLVVIGEPATRALDRGGGRRIVHEVAERLPDGVRLLVVPTLTKQGSGRSLTSELAAARLVGPGADLR